MYLKGVSRWIDTRRLTGCPSTSLNHFYRKRHEMTIKVRTKLIAPMDMIAYKVCSRGYNGTCYYSLFEPEQRLKQLYFGRESEYESCNDPHEFDLEDCYSSTGSLVRYDLGKRYFSCIPQTPGFYLYRSQEGAFKQLIVRPDVDVLKVIIPAAATVLIGVEWQGNDIICTASEIIIDSVVRK